MNFSQIATSTFVFKVYSLFLALAFAYSIWQLYTDLRKNALEYEYVIQHLVRWVLAGLFAGRLVAWLFLAETDSLDLWSFFMFWDGGLHLFSALAAFAAFAYYDLSQSKFSVGRYADLACSPLWHGVLILDLGAFLTGTAYGTPTGLPWGIQYETFGVDIITPVHPVTLYAFILHFLFLVLVEKNFRQWSAHPWRTTVYSLLFYAVTDFFLQFLHAEKTLILFETLRLSQLLDLALIVSLLGYTALQRRQSS